MSIQLKTAKNCNIATMAANALRINAVALFGSEKVQQLKLQQLCILLFPVTLFVALFVASEKV